MSETAVPDGGRTRLWTFQPPGAPMRHSVVAERPPLAGAVGRVRAHGKFLWLGDAKWFLRGLTYGPFAPNSQGEYLPERNRRLADFDHMRELGANAIRLYHLPTRELLDDAAARDLRVFLDVPWEKHRCFFEDWSAQDEARRRVRNTARELGRHEGVFAISVANEIPIDVVRFYGAKRVGRFVDDLIDIAHQEAPDCLVTYTNYPSTEFLTLERPDFYCANIYLDDAVELGKYLDRLHHVAGNLPLVLGEHGMDSMRSSAYGQARVITKQLNVISRRGLGGSFIFAYTDDWFTGGHQIEDWAFGVTTRDRVEKPAAEILRRIWSPSRVEPVGGMPRVSVVVCSYNGARTLRECLQSLSVLNYPDYEVLLVDDGSKDETPRIAADFPNVRYFRQTNHGLSVARNNGALAATGEIVAYTDDDCVADPDWLKYLIRAMQDQRADAIGGPNVPPPSDSAIARCVAASPGGPSHVMLDDRRAEHVPGCNMAFRRDRLLDIGGFDEQFRVAGDDVDICWRFLDAGLTIGYASAALVWHHRRTSVMAYFKQQRGYGKAEAMLHFKYPQRFNGLGTSRWRGIIYGEGAVGLPITPAAVYHGRFGSGLFQIIYRNNAFSAWVYPTLLEWHAVALLVLSLGVIHPAFAFGALAMWVATLFITARSASRAPLSGDGPAWRRPLVFSFYLLQPLIRAAYRYGHRLLDKRLPFVAVEHDRDTVDLHVKRIGHARYDVYWTSNQYRGRAEFLHALEETAAKHRWHGDFTREWDEMDAYLVGDRWNNIGIRTATEELGWPKRFTRVRLILLPTMLTWAVVGALALFTTEATIEWGMVGAAGAMAGWSGFLGHVLLSIRKCRRAVASLIWQAGLDAGLDPVPMREERVPARHSGDLPMVVTS